jgi:hypothetical protein
VSDGRLPGRQWLAAPKIRRAARQLLATASPRELYAAVERAEQSQEHPVVRVVDDLVAGLQTTAAASAQPGSLLRRDQRHGLPRMAVRSADRLAGQLVTAMALPHRLPPESWHILRLSLQSIAPALPNELPAEVP